MKQSWIRSAESSKDKIVEMYRKDGYEARKKGKYHESLACFNKALEIRPEDPRNWFERGSLLFDMGDFLGAVRDYELVLKFDPGNPNAICNIGMAGRHANAAVAVAEVPGEICDRAVRVIGARCVEIATQAIASVAEGRDRRIVDIVHREVVAVTASLADRIGGGRADPMPAIRYGGAVPLNAVWCGGIDADAVTIHEELYLGNPVIIAGVRCNGH